MRAFYGSADQVGKFTVFNIAGNKYRMITVIHFNTGRVYVRRILTHAEYDRGAWVEQYEGQAHPVPPTSDTELLQHLLEAQDATPDHIAQATGIAPATLVAVLAGTQRLTREHIGMLARYFQVSPGVFTFGE